ncbi:KdsC family phosphatase [Modicisalibacter xianhensis]|uniref:3-deoxy-D-manno-octulosonate 8-phosphate phosphatase KdsC n=1 Tax=Modicisalibacter xianhensis TaxID=442341 RepID=A0A1I3BXU1_9GAMM|nr:HAD hydrolase family protein [Halomonas xianhensis]SFH67107.1 3-deoxy-D-manno-octulosonate 8-phosphate phosphatase (KDO 8-P phosphatase) [Halomonas xianhensis]
MVLDPRLNSPGLIERARHIRLLVLDVDGVMTDGQLYFQADGQETKAFSTQDGLGIKLLQRAGVRVAIITGRESPMVSQRAAALGIEHVFQGRDDKLEVLKGLLPQLGIDFSEVAYCGDDLPDLPSLRQAGLGISVPNAPAYIREYAAWVTARRGGDGAVREICDGLLQMQGHWASVLDTFLYGQD